MRAVKIQGGVKSTGSIGNVYYVYTDGGKYVDKFDRKNQAKDFMERNEAMVKVLSAGNFSIAGQIIEGAY